MSRNRRAANAFALRPHLRIQHLVVVHHQAFEQRLAGAHLGPALHRHQRRLVVRPDGPLAVAQGLQPRAHRLLAGQAHPHRQRVDQAADHLVRARDAAGAPARVAPNTTSSSPAQRPSNSAQAPCIPELAVDVPAPRRWRLLGASGQRCRPLEALQSCRPEGPGRVEIQTGDVAHVLGEVWSNLRCPDSLVAFRFVRLEHLVEHDRERPAITQDVMERPHHVPPLLATSDHRETHQRRTLDVEPGCALRPE
jgi:hypothetical protein